MKIAQEFYSAFRDQAGITPAMKNRVSDGNCN